MRFVWRCHSSAVHDVMCRWKILCIFPVDKNSSVVLDKWLFGSDLSASLLCSAIHVLCNMRQNSTWLLFIIYYYWDTELSWVCSMELDGWDCEWLVQTVKPSSKHHLSRAVRLEPFERCLLYKFYPSHCDTENCAKCSRIVFTYWDVQLDILSCH